MIKLIIFDWDDVIVEGAKQGYYQCYRQTLKELGVTLGEYEFDKRIKKYWGRPHKEELRELLKESPESLEEACKIFLHHKQGSTFLSAVKPIEGVNNTLTKLSQEYKLAVATSNQPDIIQQLINLYSIPNIFSQIITAYDNIIPPEKSKPDPLMINIILNKQQIEPKETIYVGDATNDVLMAQRAGVTPVVVLTGHLNLNEAKTLGVKYIIENVTHLSDLIKTL